jgi:leucyl aminopeptidase (aminopeptidase T)
VDLTHARINRRRTSGAEPPAPIAAAMLDADVCLCIAERSLFHTRATEAAQAIGTRGVFNSPPLISAWTEGAMVADFFEIRETNLRLGARIREAEELHVTSPAGTDLVVGVHGREPKGLLTGICRNPGEVSAYPGGEVSFPPLEGTSHGIAVIERVMTDLGGLEGPITLRVVDGLVTDIDGGPDAARLLELIDGVENARNLAELGIGTNPTARISDEITESKKRLGTAHVAMGDSAAGYGGITECDVHVDGLILDVRVEANGKAIVENGRVVA